MGGTPTVDWSGTWTSLKDFGAGATSALTPTVDWSGTWTSFKDFVTDFAVDIMANHTMTDVGEDFAYDDAAILSRQICYGIDDADAAQICYGLYDGLYDGEPMEPTRIPTTEQLSTQTDPSSWIAISTQTDPATQSPIAVGFVTGVVVGFVAAVMMMMVVAVVLWCV